MLPAIKAADKAPQETRHWQHVNCQESPSACLEAGAAAARHLDNLATELDTLDMS